MADLCILKPCYPALPQEFGKVMMVEDALSSRLQLQLVKQPCEKSLSLLLGVAFNCLGYYVFKFIIFLKSEVMSICSEIICSQFAEQVPTPAF